MHTLETLGVRPADEFAALHAIHAVETRALSQLSGEPENTSAAQQMAIRRASEAVREHITSHILPNQQTTELRNLGVNHDPTNAHLQNGLLPFAVFLSFVSARGRWGEALAEDLLRGILQSIRDRSATTDYAAIEETVSFCKSYEECSPDGDLVFECVWAALFNSDEVGEVVESLLEIWMTEQLHSFDKILETFPLEFRDADGR